MVRKRVSLLKRFKPSDWLWWDNLSPKDRQAYEHQTELYRGWKKQKHKNSFSFLDPLKFITKDNE